MVRTHRLSRPRVYTVTVLNLHHGLSSCRFTSPSSFLTHLTLLFFLLFLKANIFGTEQDRVNCSFYYKVCGFHIWLLVRPE